MIGGDENGPNAKWPQGHLAVFSEDIAFACHVRATHLPPPSHYVRVLVVLTTPLNKLSKMVGNSVSYSLNSW